MGRGKLPARLALGSYLLAGGQRLLRFQHHDTIERPGVDRDSKHAALAEFATQRDVAAECLGEAAADSQSQTGAAKFSRHRGIGLHERVENRLLLVFGTPMPLSITAIVSCG